MKYLIAIENERSFNGAAKACGVTQPTLSAGIKELEYILDQQLVIRGTRKNIALTAFGEETVQIAREIINKTNRITARAKQMKAPLTGPLRFGIIPTIAPYFLPRILPSIKETFPELELYLHEGLSDDSLQKLQQGSLDVLLMAFPFEVFDVTQMPLFEEPLVFACHKNKMPEKNKISTDDLKDYNLLLLDSGHCLRDQIFSACPAPSHRLDNTYSATSLQTLMHMVDNGYGVTLLPEMALPIKALFKNVEMLPFERPAPTRQISLVWKKGHPRKTEFETLGKAILRGHTAPNTNA